MQNTLVWVQESSVIMLVQDNTSVVARLCSTIVHTLYDATPAADGTAAIGVVRSYIRSAPAQVALCAPRRALQATRFFCV